MMKQFLKLLILLFVTFTTNQTFANHITGGDLSYKCLGGRTYEFTLSVYTECTNSKNDPYFDIIYYSESLGGKRESKSPTSFRVNLFSQKEVSLYCAGIVTNCSFGGENRGLIKKNYVGVITLPKDAPDWVFMFKQASRTFDNTTSENSFESDFIIEAKLNTVLAPCNNSPQFDIEGQSINNAYVNQNSSIGVGGLEIDGDQLKYSFSVPLVNVNQNLKYNSGSSYTNFVKTSVTPSIDNQGFLNLTASASNQIGTTDIKIEEFRNGQLIASVTRNIQVITKTSENNAPVISNWKDTNDVTINKDTLQFCEQEDVIKKHFNIHASDKDSEDKLTFKFFPAKYQDWFLLEEDRASLIKVFSKADIGTHEIKLTVQDNHCPESRSIEKIFYIRVNPIPEFDLGLDYNINCKLPTEIIPVIKPNTGSKYTYSWVSYVPSFFSTTGYASLGEKSKAPTYSPDFISKTKLFLKNEFGCSFVDSIVSSSDLELNGFGMEGVCFESGKSHTTTYIGPNPESFKNKIVAYDWTFQPGNIKATTQNMDVVISNSGVYNVTLKVTDGLGCESTYSKNDVVCEKHTTDFKFRGQCVKSEIEFEDLTDYSETCDDGVVRERVVANWHFGNEKDTNQLGVNRIFKYQFKNPGIHDVTLITISEHFCKDSVVKQVEVFSKPDVAYFQGDTMDFVCKKPDTLLSTINLIKGFGIQTYTWLRLDTITKLYTFLKKGVDSTLLVNKDGVYEVRVEDEKGCKDTTSLAIVNTLKADFKYTPVCVLGDSMEIVDMSKGNIPVVSRTWGIGTTNTSSDSVFIFSSKIPKVYDLSLDVVDANGCKSNLKSKVNYIFIDSSAFFIDIASTQICAKDKVKANSFGPHNGFENINESQWYIGVGDTIKTKLLTHELSFPTLGDYTVYHKVIYNVDTNSTGYCVADTIVNVKVKPEFNIELFYNRVCLFDSAFFNIERIAGDSLVPIVSTEWILSNLTGAILDTIKQKSFNYYIESPGTYQIAITAIDSNGCKVKQVKPQLASSTLSRPDFSFLTKGKICANEIGKFSAGVAQNFKVENISEYYVVVNDDTIISGIGNPRTFEIDHQFDKSRINRATIYLLDEKAFISSPQYANSKENSCRASRAIDLELIALPFLDVSVDTVCPKELVTIVNKSVPTEFSGGINEFYVKNGDKWNTYPSTQKEWTQFFDVGGNHVFELAVKTDSGCVDTLRKNIYLFPGPKADFILEQRFPEAYIPLNINDSSDPSYGVEGDTTSLVSSYYDFGDGITSNKFNPIHTFDSIKIYMVEHQVENSYGCRDTIIKPLDMRPYLDVPNAFSPNKDGNNDYLGLIYKSIVDLQEYKIYNRWGQVVFDSKGDLDAIWDGTFKGEDQEVGVYVVYVRALGTYNAHFEFKKNLTLIR